MKTLKLAKNQIQKDLMKLERELDKSLISDINLATEISNYIISSGGKRIRPLISLLVARCLGYSGKYLMSLAASIELLHTATLIHDDVVDKSDTRRGKPSVNKKWDATHSVLIGDFVYSKAFQKMATLNNPKVIKLLADSTNKISEGEVMQLSLKTTFLNDKEYFEVIGRKTAELFKAAALSAAILAKAPKTQLDNVSKFSFSLGIIFQINDDLLDYFGDTRKTGKELGQDLIEGKITLPLIKAYELCNKKDRKLISNALKKLNLNDIELVKSIIVSSGALNKTIEIRNKYSKNCKKYIGKLPETEYKELLNNIVDEFIEVNF